MNRREMLRKSLRNLARTFPAMLVIPGGLRGWLPHKNGAIQYRRAACFPKGPQKPGLAKAPIFNCKEE